MKSLALRLLRFYKRWISPVFPPSCRYVPTCSEYAMEAVERYGAWRGVIMASVASVAVSSFGEGRLLDPVVEVWTRRLPRKIRPLAKSAGESSRGTIANSPATAN
jgi:putative membrane protein insertion efficiency factor